MQSIKEFLRQAPASLVVKYRDQANLSLIEIANLPGFSEASTFHRAFETWTGVAPGNTGSPAWARAPYKRLRACHRYGRQSGRGFNARPVWQTVHRSPHRFRQAAAAVRAMLARMRRLQMHRVGRNAGQRSGPSQLHGADIACHIARDCLLVHHLRIAGLRRAKALAFSARGIGADEASRLCIVHAIHDQEVIAERARRMAISFTGACWRWRRPARARRAPPNAIAMRPLPS
ncbi:hypothetical protein ABC383_24890 [Noviherbaspirillum sp. 1P10PC]|uniref:hypothetical protein n=1 Tax=Noviherbaspirillum sp. 1P10PC TaxID=3132292 RepID=UPI0039A03252